MYQLTLVAAAAYLPPHSETDPSALEKQPPQAVGEESQVPNSGSQQLLVAMVAELVVAAEGQALVPEGLRSVRRSQELGH